jgi:hypothetical protein
MDMVERVARALYKAYAIEIGYSPEAAEQEAEGMWPEWVSEARAAIAAMLEPTKEMVRAGVGALAVADYGLPEYGPEDAAEMTFSAMIDAALTSSEKGGVIERTDIP